MPKRPHSSWNLSSSSSPSSSGDMSLKAAPPRMSHTIDRHLDHGRPSPLDHQGLAPHSPYPSPGQRVLTHELLEVTLRLRPHRHDHPRRPPPRRPPPSKWLAPGRAPGADGRAAPLVYSLFLPRAKGPQPACHSSMNQ